MAFNEYYLSSIINKILPVLGQRMILQYRTFISPVKPRYFRTHIIRPKNWSRTAADAPPWRIPEWPHIFSPNVMMEQLEGYKDGNSLTSRTYLPCRRFGTKSVRRELTSVHTAIIPSGSIHRELNCLQRDTYDRAPQSCLLPRVGTQIPSPAPLSNDQTNQRWNYVFLRRLTTHLLKTLEMTRNGRLILVKGY